MGRVYTPGALLGGEPSRRWEATVKKAVEKKESATKPVTIRLLVERIRVIEALAARTHLSRSRYLELLLGQLLPDGDEDDALAALSRIIAIHELAQRQGVTGDLVTELGELVSVLARAVRQNYAQ